MTSFIVCIVIVFTINHIVHTHKQVKRWKDKAADLYQHVWVLENELEYSIDDQYGYKHGTLSS